MPAHGGVVYGHSSELRLKGQFRSSHFDHLFVDPKGVLSVYCKVLVI